MRIERRVGIGHAVQKEVVRIRPVPADADGGTLTGRQYSGFISPVCAPCPYARRGPSARGPAACGRSAAAPRRTSTRRPRPETDILSFQRFRGRGNRNGLLPSRDREGKVQRHMLSDFDHHFADLARETRRLRFDRVPRRRQAGHLKQTRFIGDGGAHGSRGRGANFHAAPKTGRWEASSILPSMVARLLCAVRDSENRPRIIPKRCI